MQISLDPGTHSMVLFQSSGLAIKPTLSRGKLPTEHFAGTATQAAAMEVTLLFWSQSHLHKLQSQQPLQCKCAFWGLHCPKSVCAIPPFRTPLWGGLQVIPFKRQSSLQNHFGSLTHPLLG